MRTPFLSTVSAAAIAVIAGGPSSAADLPLKAPPRAVVAPIQTTWTGWYLGAHAGAAWSKNSVTADGDDAFLSGETIRNAVVGVHGGYNWQFNQWVAGIEGDWSWSRGEYNTSTTIASDTSLRHRTDHLASIRGRLGMAFDRTLIYATGGYAWQTGKSNLASTGGRSDRSYTAGGGVVGGGIEWKATQQISFRVEGLHYMFNKDIVHTGPGSLAAIDQVKNTTVVRAGVTWHWGPL